MAKLIQYCTKASTFDGEFQWQAAGMGYVLVSDSGGLLVIDGGHGGDAEGILALLEGNSAVKPAVDLWIITHPHGDHYFALEAIADTPELSKRVDVRRVCYAVPEQFSWMWRGKLCNGQGDLDRLNAIAPKLGAEVLTPKTDERIEIGGFTLDFLFTWSDTTDWSSPNALSLIFTVTGGKRRAMFVGDTDEKVPGELINRMGDDFSRLKCDILQVAHHGLDGGSREFYAAVGADIVLVPISYAGARDMRLPDRTCCRHNRWAEEQAMTVIRACTGTAEVEL